LPFSPEKSSANDEFWAKNDWFEGACQAPLTPPGEAGPRQKGKGKPEPLRLARSPGNSTLKADRRAGEEGGNYS